VLLGREERKAGGLEGVRGLQREGEGGGPAGPKEKRGEGERRGVFFFKILFKFNFQTFKLHSNKKSCIQIMMHKHLLF
jgi:hypothetical protein